MRCCLKEYIYDFPSMLLTKQQNPDGLCGLSGFHYGILHSIFLYFRAEKRQIE